MGLILLGKVSNAIYKPELVEVATAVLVQSEESQHQYYICDACEDPIGDNELKPDHPLSLALIGAKVGDTIEYEESPLSKKNLSVLEIKCKYLYLHHDTIDGFTHRFPAATSSFYKLDLKTDEEGNPDLSPIFTLIDRRRSYVDYGLALYRESQLPVAVLALYLSVSPISLWFDLQYHDTEKIYCAQGTTEERESAITLVRQANTYVVDPLTAIQMAHLDIIGDVQKTPGQLVLTKSSIDLLEKLINDERLFGDQDSMALAKEGDDYIRYEDSTEEMQQRIVFFENLKETLSRELSGGTCY